jgi:LDH2 family malate/lactate/ureidoglycolate dehydrogenase
VTTAVASVTLRAAELQALVARVFRAAGAVDDTAAEVARSLVLADLRGVESHGCMRVPEYLEYIRNGRIDPRARPTVKRHGALVRVDGHGCFGQLAAREAALGAADTAAANGVAVAIVSGVKHVGRVGEFVELAAERGLIGLAFVNGGPPGGLVAPFGARTRALGTNPLAYAFPVAREAPVVADFSTAAAAEGKVRVYRQARRPLPEGWIVDADGRPSKDPEDLYRGGSLLPAAGHKGYALGLLGEVLGGVLAGEGCACTGADPGNGMVLVVLDPGVGFAALAAEAVAAVRACEPASGGGRVVVPGEPELGVEQQRLNEGIPLSPWLRVALLEAAEALGIRLPELESSSKEDNDV